MREFHAKTGIDLNALPAAPVSMLIPPLAGAAASLVQPAARSSVMPRSSPISAASATRTLFRPHTAVRPARFSKAVPRMA